MDEQNVLELLKDLHREVEQDCGKDPARVTDDVQPLDDLGGFDSPLIPTVVRMLAKKMGVVIAKGTRLKNPYISADRKQKLPLRDVAKRFCELYGKKEQPSHELTRHKATDNRGKNQGGAKNGGTLPGTSSEDARPATSFRDRDGGREPRSVSGGVGEAR